MFCPDFVVLAYIFGSETRSSPVVKTVSAFVLVGRVPVPTGSAAV
jgi:hypothetical protein